MKTIPNIQNIPPQTLKVGQHVAVGPVDYGPRILTDVIAEVVINDHSGRAVWLDIISHSHNQTWGILFYNGSQVRQATRVELAWLAVYRQIQQSFDTDPLQTTVATYDYGAWRTKLVEIAQLLVDEITSTFLQTVVRGSFESIVVRQQLDDLAHIVKRIVEVSCIDKPALERAKLQVPYPAEEVVAALSNPVRFRTWLTHPGSPRMFHRSDVYLEDGHDDGVSGHPLIQYVLAWIQGRVVVEPERTIVTQPADFRWVCYFLDGIESLMDQSQVVALLDRSLQEVRDKD